MSGWWLNGMAMGAHRENWATGIEAFVWLYYDQYTDATEIEVAAIDALDTLFSAYLQMNSDDLMTAIRKVEQEINDDGGIKSATDNTRHPVRTPSAWQEVD